MILLYTPRDNVKGLRPPLVTVGSVDLNMGLPVTESKGATSVTATIIGDGR